MEMGLGCSATNGWQKGVFLYERLVAYGGKGVSVRQLGGNRAGEMRSRGFCTIPK